WSSSPPPLIRLRSKDIDLREAGESPPLFFYGGAHASSVPPSAFCGGLFASGGFLDHGRALFVAALVTTWVGKISAVRCKISSLKRFFSAKDLHRLCESPSPRPHERGSCRPNLRLRPICHSSKTLARTRGLKMTDGSCKTSLHSHE